VYREAAKYDGYKVYPREFIPEFHKVYIETASHDG
jgi:hypothetical protein